MIETRKLTTILAGCGLVAALGALPAAVAANDVTSDPTPLVLAQATAFDDEKIEAFAAALVQVEEIRASYSGPFQAAQTEEQRQQINQEAAQEMMEAVEEAPNITLEEYDALLQAAQQDPELADRINQAVENTQI
ncbi:DUF4168 domain-containing protein [Meridianimarinicoccus sp. RP-17]|uniref:DUF4168 domain-containing protein n=1 Tax=Meridianimarinicoccus zhengii TaxID=2056810 RepID=UPI000DAE78AF|nr:DUF4168 domain-containing protein [Phycocomes zhengii]